MLRSDFELIVDLPIEEKYKMVLFVLLRFRNGRNGRCDPSKKLIGEKIGYTERVAYERLQWLRRAGYVSIAELGGGSGRTTNYYLHLDGCAQRENPARTITEFNPEDPRNPAANPEPNPADSRDPKTNKVLNSLTHEHGGGKPPRSEKRSGPERSIFARALANGR